MAHDVFISYSSEDKTVADAVCATLENRKIRCWIAPRDVTPGQPFAASLINAVISSSVMVLVLSKGSNQSQYVLRELNEAVDKGIPIIPFRIEDVEPSEELRFYIKSLHWLDAMDPPMERHLKRLSDSVQALLSVGEEYQPPDTETVVGAPAQKQRSFPVWVIALLVLAVVIVLVTVSLWIVPRLNSAPPSPTSPTVGLVADPTDILIPEQTPITNTPTPLVVDWFINQVEINEFRLFNSGEDPITPPQRVYSHNFEQTNARIIYCELDLNHTGPVENTTFVMRAVYHDPDGDVYGVAEIKPVVKAGWTWSNWVLGFGWDYPGNWDVGTYRVDVYVGDEKIASDSFKIQPLEPSSEPGWSDWRSLTFEIQNEFLWRDSEDGSYTAFAQEDNDSFAWSNEIVDGDFILNLDITSEDDYSFAHIIVYGDAMGFSDGNLIFEIGDENSQFI